MGVSEFGKTTKNIGTTNIGTTHPLYFASITVCNIEMYSTRKTDNELDEIHLHLHVISCFLSSAENSD